MLAHWAHIDIRCREPLFIFYAYLRTGNIPFKVASIMVLCSPSLLK